MGQTGDCKMNRYQGTLSKVVLDKENVRKCLHAYSLTGISNILNKEGGLNIFMFFTRIIYVYANIYRWLVPNL